MGAASRLRGETSIAAPAESEESFRHTNSIRGPQSQIWLSGARAIPRRVKLWLCARSPCTLSSCSDVNTRCIDVIRSMARFLKERIVFFLLLLLLRGEENSRRSSTVLSRAMFPRVAERLIPNTLSMKTRTTRRRAQTSAWDRNGSAHREILRFFL